MIVPAGSKRLLLTWVGLVVITTGYVALHGSERASAAVTLAAIGIALLKVRIIFREFMEVRHAPVVLSRVTDLCVALMGILMVGSYLVGRSVQ